MRAVILDQGIDRDALYVKQQSMGQHDRAGNRRANDVLALVA